MTSPGPSVIVNPAPATGLLVRKPRMQVYCDGTLLPFVLNLTITRGLDQDLATCDITYPHPLPDFVRKWSKVQVVMGTDRFVERFTGYIVNFDTALWPGAKTVHCQDILAIAAHKYTPEEMDLHGFTDSEAVREVLGGCGYHDSTYAGVDPDGGTGSILADVEEAQLWWELGQTGLEKILDIDEISLGWRTYATVSGAIVRSLVSTDPNTVAALHTFGEGVDIIEGSATIEEIDPKNEITVSGFDGSVVVTLDPADDPFAWTTNSYWKRYLALQTVARGAGVIDPEDVATYILSQIGQPLLTITFSTHLDILFAGQEVIGVTSERLEVDQHFWVQSVSIEAQADGSFTQTITAVSTVEHSNRHMVQPPVDVPEGEDPPGTDITYPVIDPVPAVPGPADLRPDFAIISIDRELAAPPDLPEDLGSTYYIVAASDTSTSRIGTIVTRAWTAAGTGVRIASGDGLTFTTAFTDISTATITLAVTDSNGSTASITRPVEDATVPVRARTLFACTETEMYANDGDVWRKQAPAGAASVQVVANGPMWGCENLVAISEDYLATAATEVAAFPAGSTVSAVWIAEQDSRFVAAGTVGGLVAVSRDRGATWEARSSPGAAVDFIIVSIFDTSELHVVTPLGWLTSHNEGESWDLVREGDFTYLELSHTRNIIVTAAGTLEKAEDGVPFTGITGTVVAATAHIREDRFYALTDDGNTWVQDTAGSYAMVAGAPMPASGTPAHAGTYRDGLVVDLVFFAAQDAGLFKTLDGFQTANGYLRILSEGRLTP